MWNEIKQLFAIEPELSDEDKNLQQWVAAVRDNNWVLLHHLGRAENLEPNQLFDKVALAYCHCYAAGVEPTRIDAWTAFRKTLENLHYPAFAQATTIRHDQKAKE